jgi:hypothetical protein
MNVIYNIIPLTQYAAVILVSSCKTLLLGEVVSPLSNLGMSPSCISNYPPFQRTYLLHAGFRFTQIRLGSHHRFPRNPLQSYYNFSI